MDKQNTTIQKIIIENSKNLESISDKSVDLIITSPPYPMISMWDEIFNFLNPNITSDLIQNNSNKAFELMHEELNMIYDTAIKKLKDDGVVCINIGDATRTCNGVFSIYPNGSKTIEYFRKKGFMLLPSIIWNKPTNSPNKFMGSGMLPVGAYNTLEFEHILIFRRKKREFKNLNEKNNRSNSGFFWNERNVWCSNIWNFVGSKQTNKNNSRDRSGSFPIELPYRIISMWTVAGDTVLDIFAGTGTTLLATTALKRNGIGVEIIPEFKKEIRERIISSKDELNKKNYLRVKKYKEFILDWEIKKQKKVKYQNTELNLPVMTKQEVNIKIPIISNFISNKNEIIVEYDE